MINGVMIKNPSRKDFKTTLFPNLDANGINTCSNFFCISSKPPLLLNLVTVLVLKGG